ncbi:hypothetical protein Tco_0467610 [Tanacetum coccineum]
MDIYIYENCGLLYLVQDRDANDVDEHLYRSMIGSLMYLTASNQDIMFAVCGCVRFQVSPKTSHLLAVKRIFRYLKGKPSLGLWYSKDSPLELVAYTDSDYARATQDRKSTTGGYLLTKGFDAGRFQYLVSRSEGFHQVIDFLNRSHICYALTKKPDVYISFIKQFWRSAEATNDDNGEVQITATIDEQHIPTPNESPLHAVHSHGSAEGSLKLNELTTLVTKLSERLGVLEDDLKKTKLTYSAAVTKLILRVKKLESKVKAGTTRKRARVVLSEDDEDVEDDSSKQGRKLSDAEVQEKASTETEPIIQEVTPTEVIQDQGSSEKGNSEVSTAGATKGTASEVPVVSTAEVNISTAGRTVTYRRRSEEKS